MVHAMPISIARIDFNVNAFCHILVIRTYSVLGRGFRKIRAEVSVIRNLLLQGMILMKQVSQQVTQ